MIHKIQVFIILIIIPLGALMLYLDREGKSLWDVFDPGVPIAHVGEIPIKVEIADTPALRAKGLSDRDDLEGVSGMLFVFDTVERHSMWMHNMRFPIDIIWIDENLTVVQIDRNVHPDTYPRKFYAPVPVPYAIETKAQYTDTFGIREGAKVRLPLEVEGRAN